jgi:hypothetical protein
MTIPNAAIKYDLGVTYINSSGSWNPLKGAWVQQANVWTPVQTGWICHDDGTWERIYPTPRGIFTANVTSIAHNFYQYHFDTPNTVEITNTGDYDLVIDAIQINDSANNFSTTASQRLLLPYTITPNATANIGFTVYGNSVGTFSGNLQFYANTGYLGEVITTIPVTANILTDYNGIATVSTTPVQMTINLGDETTIYSQYAPGTYSYTIPNNVMSVSITLVGGGGGGGGTDSHGGANGYGGWIISGPLAVTPGDTLAFHVGGGGGAGANATEGGFAAGGYSDAGFSGGTGGPSGYSGGSGAGGGGGAATALYQNSNLIAVAAGGGGGGGGGNNSYGQGQEGWASSGSDAGGAGGNRGGSDGGGPGGGGGGNPGGAAGDIVGGDNGSYSGRDGQNLTPAGWSVTRNNNGGGANSSAGGSGSMILTEYSIATDAAQTVTIQNSGNGANLNISNIVSQNGLFTISNLNPASGPIGYNFNTFTGNLATFTVTPYTFAQLGTYTDNVIITSDAVNAPNFSIPVNITVTTPNGNAVYQTPGNYSLVVPAHVHSINLLAVAGGGGGGAGYSIQGGGGGGGGSGGYTAPQNVIVTPGETLNISVGQGGGNNLGGSVTVFPVSLSYSWSSFMNAYAVWVNSDGVSPVGMWSSFSRQWSASVTGTYTINLSADNHAQALINGTLIGTSNDYTTTSSFTFTVSNVDNTVSFNCLNDGGPAGVAATITDPNNNIVWTTRTLTDINAGAPGSSTAIYGSFGSIIVNGGGAGGSGTYTTVTTQYYGGGVGGDGGSGSGGGGGCFLTTATVQALGLPDDCEELQLARKLRDGMLSDNKDKKVVELYYKVAPTITERKTSWVDFYQNAIEPITGLVKLGRHADAIKVYKYETVKLINEYITYNDRELVEAIFEAGFTKTDLPYAVKYACMKAYFAIKLPIAKWKINHGILRR